MKPLFAAHTPRKAWPKLLLSILAHLAQERRFHGRRDSIDNGQARATTPGRGARNRIVGDHRFDGIPVG